MESSLKTYAPIGQSRRAVERLREPPEVRSPDRALQSTDPASPETERLSGRRPLLKQPVPVQFGQTSLQYQLYYIELRSRL